MFGYVAPDLTALDDTQKKRFRRLYCGLCTSLGRRYGLRGTVALSYDLTFLSMLLGALYEPGETEGRRRCPMHPLSGTAYAVSDWTDYAADMDILLFWYKLRDNWQDDRSAAGRAGMTLLRRGFERASAAHPGKRRAVEDWITRIDVIEKDGSAGIDAPVNATGDMLAELFCPDEDDFWAPQLRQIGSGLGRFIYFMDACEDLPADLKRGRFNPLREYRERPDLDRMCLETLEVMAGDAAEAFELLPVERDADLIRNVLYRGIWTRWARMHRKEKNGKGAPPEASETGK